MRFVDKKLKLDKSLVKVEYQRVPNVRLVEFTKPLVKQESDRVGEIMLEYEREKQRILKRLAGLNDVQVLNSQVAGQPVGIIVPEEDLEKIKQRLLE